jgi:hypothetical protein
VLAAGSDYPRHGYGFFCDPYNNWQRLNSQENTVFGRVFIKIRSLTIVINQDLILILKSIGGIFAVI